GRSAASFLLSQGYEVVGFDDKPRKDFEVPGMLLISSFEEIDWSRISLLIVSPGISPKHLVYQKAVELEIEIIGEAELALRYLNCKAVAITGTNGKTTTTLLVEHVLQSAGIRAKALGNVGDSLTSFLHKSSIEVAVIELSSYQLETLSCRAFDGAVLLNITPDHLERHGSMQGYAKVKFHLSDLLKPCAPFFVSPRVAKEWGGFIKPSYSIYPMDIETIERILPLHYRELGEHDIENGMAAWSLCSLLGVSSEIFYQACTTFKKPRHRIEFVRELNGISFINDSKGTNVDAVLYSVKAMKGNIILIAGGVDKVESYPDAGSSCAKSICICSSRGCCFTLARMCKL
ncbi:MAG: hypothetical protein HYZ48_04320, partial [Chlamydiales bacterium]|nr:hypothetical protein [Chlamydiales bacterium]